jgi:hypothetical protein
MSYNTRTDFWVPFKENKIPFSDQISFGWKNYLNNEFSFSVESGKSLTLKIYDFINIDNKAVIVRQNEPFSPQLRRSGKEGNAYHDKQNSYPACERNRLMKNENGGQRSENITDAYQWISKR